VHRSADKLAEVAVIDFKVMLPLPDACAFSVRVEIGQQGILRLARIPGRLKWIGKDRFLAEPDALNY
jgi:hypothetical protein